jgi:SAM-dependent methyltransferase
MDNGSERGGFVFRVAGWCPLCEQKTEFVAARDTPLDECWFPNWFRGDLLCVHCASIPRQRAIFSVIQMLYPNWRNLGNESSAGSGGASERLRKECQCYTSSQYDKALLAGQVHPHAGHRSEDLEAQSFLAESFDIVVTQDVFEHLFAPDRAIKEIARTLRPGGAHILTVPIVRGTEPIVRRARIEDNSVRYIMEPQYHGNPMSETGSLVTIDWGYDIIDYLAAHSGLSVSMFYIDDISRGIRAACIEVLVCKKLTAPPGL